MNWFYEDKKMMVMDMGKYRRKETQITLSDTFWNLVTKGRKKIQDAS
jgi:predicted DNA-binding protein (UPF0251 family)